MRSTLHTVALVGLFSGVFAAERDDLRVHPAEVELVGGRARQQLVVTARSPDRARDVTGDCTYSVEDPTVVKVSATGLLRARRNGVARVRIEYDGEVAWATAEVRGHERERPVSFRHEIVALFARHGCSAGACHGSPKGKNGFRLSLRGSDPALDHAALIREVTSRRVDRVRPESSLLLLKATGRVPHEGGQRFSPASGAGRLMREWVGDGSRDDVATAARLTGIEVFPPDRGLRLPAERQQLAVTAVFADGIRRDVTHLTVFTVDEPEIAEITPSAVLERRGTGEVTVLARYLDRFATARVAFLPASAPRVAYPAARNYVDEHVFDKLRRLGIPPAPRASDSEFLRRLHLDLLGLLPTAAEAESFLADGSPDKRDRLIDELLERPEFDDFWSLKWLDVLGSNRKKLGHRAVYKLHAWVRNAIATRRPLDVMARALLTARGDVNQHPEANFYRVARDPRTCAETTAQLFLGVRIGCARCHNHPFERWTQDDYYGLASLFSSVRLKGPGTRQVVWLDPAAPFLTSPRTGQLAPPRALGSPLSPPENGDYRAAFAAWLTSADNRFFSRSLANRIWYHLLGHGIVDPPDDFRDSNPPSNEKLLAALAGDLAGSRFDLRHLVRVIVRSNTYQRSSRVAPGGGQDNKYFSHGLPRLLTAEQCLDALCFVTGVAESYPGMPAGTRASQLPEAAVDHPLLSTLGKPQRTIACECERESGASFASALELCRGETLQGKIREKKNRIGRLMEAGRSDPEIVEELYLAALARAPTADEWKRLWDHCAGSADRREALEDVLWSLLNSKEFLFRR